LIFGETLVLFLLSLLGAFLLIAAIKPFAESQLEHSIRAILNPYVLWPLLMIIIILVGITSYLPGRFFSLIPVASVFRKYRQGKNKWKQGLLAVQFIGSSFILIVMTVVTLQYSNMKNADHGYQTKGVYYGSTVGIDGSKLPVILNELRAMPEVEQVGIGTDLPLSGASGNNVRSIEKNQDLFNVADFYFADENFLSILGIRASRGSDFSPETALENDVLISEKGAGLLLMNTGWTDGVVGKQVVITEHGNTNICGVFPDFVIRSMANPDERPAVFFYTPESRFEEMKREKPGAPFLILVKVVEGSEAGMMKKFREVFNLGMAEDDAIIYSLESELQNNYASEKGFRNALLAGNMVIFLITVIGLIGYTTSEANRRRKELSIRRINGARHSNILRIFILDLGYLAVPSVVAGLIAAWLTVDKWMQNFAVKISLQWQIFFLCSFFILLLVAAVSILNYYRTANRNPVEALRYE
jgi:putative ABC transport system permease protein